MAEVIGQCSACKAQVPADHPYGWCSRCGEQLPRELRLQLSNPYVAALQREAGIPVAGSEEERADRGSGPPLSLQEERGRSLLLLALFLSFIPLILISLLAPPTRAENYAVYAPGLLLGLLLGLTWRGSRVARLSCAAWLVVGGGVPLILLVQPEALSLNTILLVASKAVAWFGAAGLLVFSASVAAFQERQRKEKEPTP